MTGIKRKIWTLIRGGSFKGYLRTVSGHPLTLTDCMAVQPVSLAVSGNAVQDGTPSPDNPVEVQGVGERTANLFDKDGTATEYPTNSALFYYTVGGFHGEPYGYKVPLMFSGKNLFNKDIIDNTANITRSGDKFMLSGYACTTGLTPEKFLKMTGLKPGDTVTLSRVANVIAGVPSAVTGRISFISKSDGAAWLGLNGTYTIPQNFSSNNYTSMCLYGAQHADDDGEQLVEMYDIQILKGSYTAKTMPPYEPYHELQTYPIYLDAPLYGVDGASDTIEIDVEHKRATLTRQIEKLVINGATNIVDTWFPTGVVNLAKSKYIKPGTTTLCTHTSAASDGKIGQSNALGSGLRIMCINSYWGFDDIPSFKTWLTDNPITAYYQLMTPITTDISDKIDWDSIPELWRGTVIVTADTEIKPTSIAVEYYADKPGGGD